MGRRIVTTWLATGFAGSVLCLPAPMAPADDLENALRIIGGAAIVLDALGKTGAPTTPDAPPAGPGDGRGSPKVGQTGAGGRAPLPPDPRLMAAQTRLNALGYDAGKPDGRDGRRTQAAVSQFQSDFGLAATGTLSSAEHGLLQSNAALVTVRTQMTGRAQPMLLHVGFDVPNGDYRNPSLDPSLQGITLDQCYAACMSDQLCSAFTFNTDRNWCFLKQGVSAAAVYAGAISGFKTAPSVNGGMVAQMPVPALAQPPVAAVTPPAGSQAPELFPESTTPTPAPSGAAAQSPAQGPGGDAQTLPAFGAAGNSPSPAQGLPQLPAMGNAGLPALPALGAQSADVTGTWRASYVCRAQVQAELQIVRGENGGYGGTAKFEAVSPQGEQVSGTHELHVRFDPATRRLRTSNGEWIRQPSSDVFVHTSYEGTVDLQNGSFLVPLSRSDCPVAVNVAFARVPQAVLEEERAAAEVLRQQFASSPVFGAWRGWTMCAGGPVGVAVRTDVEGPGLAARVRTFPLIQNPVAPSMEFYASVTDAGGGFILRAAPERQGDALRRSLDNAAIIPFTAQLQWDPAQNALIGGLDAPGCQGLALTKIEDAQFDDLFVRYDKEAGVATAGDMSPARQVFTAPTLNAACQSVLAWEHSLYAGYGNVRRFDAVRGRERKRPEVPFAIFLPELFTPFFGKAPGEISADEGTALASVILQCIKDDYPLDTYELLLAYLPNAHLASGADTTRRQAESNRAHIVKALDVVAPSYAWREEALAALAGLTYQPAEKSTLTGLSRDLDRKGGYLLPQHEQELRDALKVATDKVDLAVAKEAERRRAAFLQELLAKLQQDPAAMNLAEVTTIIAAAREKEIGLTDEQDAALEAALAARFAPMHEELSGVAGTDLQSDEFEKVAEKIEAEIIPFRGYKPASELSAAVLAARQDRQRRQVTEVDEALAKISGKQDLITTSIAINRLKESGAPSFVVEEKRHQLAEKAEVWVTAFLRDEQVTKLASIPAVPGSAQGTTESSASSPASPTSLLGDFAGLAGTAPSASTAALSAVPDVFTSGILKQDRLLRGLYEGNFNAVYAMPRSTTDFYVVKFAEYFQQACPAVVPAGMVTYIARSRMPEGVLSGDPNAMASAGYDVLLQTLQQITQPDKYFADGIRTAELQTQFEGDAMALGQAFGCPGEGLRKIIENAFTFYKDPTAGVSARSISMMDACRQSDEHIMTSGVERYCGCAVPILESSLSEDFQTYLKGNPRERFRDIWSIFGEVAVAQQHCRL